MRNISSKMQFFRRWRTVVCPEIYRLRSSFGQWRVWNWKSEFLFNLFLVYESTTAVIIKSQTAEAPFTFREEIIEMDGGRTARNEGRFVFECAWEVANKVCFSVCD